MWCPTSWCFVSCVASSVLIPQVSDLLMLSSSPWHVELPPIAVTSVHPKCAYLPTICPSIMCKWVICYCCPSTMCKWVICYCCPPCASSQSVTNSFWSWIRIIKFIGFVRALHLLWNIGDGRWILKSSLDFNEPDDSNSTSETVYCCPSTTFMLSKTLLLSFHHVREWNPSVPAVSLSSWIWAISYCCPGVWCYSVPK